MIRFDGKNRRNTASDARDRFGNEYLQHLNLVAQQVTAVNFLTGRPVKWGLICLAPNHSNGSDNKGLWRAFPGKLVP